MSKIHVTREVHIRAVEPVSIYAGATYASASGRSLIETVRHEALALPPGAGRHYYERKLYRRRSDDNGKTWRVAETIRESGPELRAGKHLFPLATFLDKKNDTLISLCSSYEVDPTQHQFSLGNLIKRTYQMHAQHSRDGGNTWTNPRQIIDERSEYNQNRWSPITHYGETGGVADGQPVFLPDGSFVIAFTVYHPQAPAEDIGERATELYASVIHARARWSSDRQNLLWRFGEPIRVDYPLASGGCCEPALAWLGGTRLFNTMRCQGDEATGVFSTRFTTISQDAGMTWSKPDPLRYDDNTIVHTPASQHRFIVSSKTRHTYLVANFLPAPVYAQTPRYPLSIARFDTNTCRVIRSSLQVIQDRPSDAPADRRYTNFGIYEDRATGDFVMTLPEMPRTKNYNEMLPEDFGSDCLRYRICLGE